MKVLGCFEMKKESLDGVFVEIYVGIWECYFFYNLIVSNVIEKIFGSCFCLILFK